jgi:hypothetical protein
VVVSGRIVELEPPSARVAFGPHPVECTPFTPDMAACSSTEEQGYGL